MQCISNGNNFIALNQVGGCSSHCINSGWSVGLVLLKACMKNLVIFIMAFSESEWNQGDIYRLTAEKKEEAG